MLLVTALFLFYTIQSEHLFWFNILASSWTFFPSFSLLINITSFSFSSYIFLLFLTLKSARILISNISACDSIFSLCVTISPEILIFGRNQNTFPSLLFYICQNNTICSCKKTWIMKNKYLIDIQLQSFNVRRFQLFSWFSVLGCLIIWGKLNQSSI